MPDPQMPVQQIYQNWKVPLQQIMITCSTRVFDPLPVDLKTTSSAKDHFSKYIANCSSSRDVITWFIT